MSHLTSSVLFRDSEVKICVTCGNEFYETEPDCSHLPTTILLDPTLAKIFEPESQNVNAIFLTCFSSQDDYDISDCSSDSQFCEPCKKQLMEWNRNMNFVSELLLQANKIKLILTAKILENSKLRNSTVESFNTGDNTHISSCSKINRVVHRIRAGKHYKR